MKPETTVRTATFLLLTLLASSLAVAADPPAPVEVRADKLDVDNRTRQAHFTGNVRAKYGAMTLKCAAMVVTYSDKGAILKLSARGGITVTQGDSVATADEASLNASTSQLSLTGNPTLVRGPNRLSGERIDVNLLTGDIQVHRAVGTFVFDSVHRP